MQMWADWHMRMCFAVFRPPSCTVSNREITERLRWRQGLHSWIQYHLEERNGHLEYRGYLHPHAGPKASAEDRVISVHFSAHLPRCHC